MKHESNLIYMNIAKKKIYNNNNNNNSKTKKLLSKIIQIICSITMAKWRMHCKQQQSPDLCYK